jgi:hypothetical protein
MRYTLITAVLILAGTARAAAQPPAIFVSRPQQVVRLIDRNGDGDFLDYAERTTYADGLPSNLGAVAGDAQRLFVVDAAGARLLCLRDLNADGDALDYAEVAIYAELPQAGLSPIASGLALSGDALFVADSANGLLYRFRDLNQDGDALDLDECTLVAGGLVAPSAVSVRPDGRLLAAQGSASVPVRILCDHNADGDFLDFAENISYAEQIAPGQDLIAEGDMIADFTRPSEGKIIRLLDRNGDGDVLDYGEVLLFAENLDQPFAAAADAGGGLFVAARDAAGTIYRVLDRNGDGDALDYAEVMTVALGIQQPGGVALVNNVVQCLAGDIDGNGMADLNDVPLFVSALLGLTTLSDPCPADCNNDGLIDAADIPPFIVAVL